MYRQKERISLLLSKRWQENLVQNYDARYNNLVRDKLCSKVSGGRQNSQSDYWLRF